MIEVMPEDEGTRLDRFFMGFCSQQHLGVSRTQLQKMIHQGHVSVGEAPALKAHAKVKAGHTIRIFIEAKEPQALAAENIALDIVYEDNDLAIINKQPGLVVHPAPGNYAHTLANALLYHIKSLSDINPQRPGIVHRLDKDTSGLLVIAKNNAVHLALVKQFSQHSITRTYVALVKGKVEFKEHVIELPIGRHPHKRKSMAVGFGKNTKYAKTFYRTLQRTKEYSVLELLPFTGRTHQLRVHLAFLGHPILGDKKYGKNNDFARLALHAVSLGFIHPSSGKYVEFSCALPPEFSAMMSPP